MKKLLCATLALIMVFSLCACGQENPNNTSGDNISNSENNQNGDNQTQETTLPAEPTEEEKNVLLAYVEAVKNFNIKCAEMVDSNNGGGVHYAVTQLLALDMDTVSKWADTEWAEWAYKKCDKPSDFNQPADWDWQAVQSQIAVVKNVKLTHTKTTVDHLGNKNSAENVTSWYYNADGSVRAINGEFNYNKISVNSLPQLSSSAPNFREYDEENRLSKITYWSSGKVAFVCTFTYDAQGNISEMVRQDNYNEYRYSFTCDNAGRVTNINWTTSDLAGGDYQITYAYDAEGRLVREEKIRIDNNRTENKEFVLYTYDGNGKLTESTYTVQNYDNVTITDLHMNAETINRSTYVYDEQGHLVQEIMVMGDTVHYNKNGEITKTTKPTYAQIIYDTTYGDYYVYAPAE